MNIICTRPHRIPNQHPMSPRLHPLAAASRDAAENSQRLSGGGNLPPSRYNRHISAPPSRVPAVKLVAHVANQRHPPVFPLYTLAANWRISQLGHNVPLKILLAILAIWRFKS